MSICLSMKGKVPGNSELGKLPWENTDTLEIPGQTHQHLWTHTKLDKDSKLNSKRMSNVLKERLWALPQFNLSQHEGSSWPRAV